MSSKVLSLHVASKRAHARSIVCLAHYESASDMWFKIPRHDVAPHCCDTAFCSQLQFPLKAETDCLLHAHVAWACLPKTLQVLLITASTLH